MIPEGPFRVRPYRGYDKTIFIDGPDDLQLMVDYDDVNHHVVDGLVASMVEWLNQMPKEAIDIPIAEGNRLAELEWAREEESDRFVWQPGDKLIVDDDANELRK